MDWFTSLRRPFRNWFLLPSLGVVTLVGVLLLGWQPPAIANTARHYTELEFPSLPEIQIPAYERYELPNGLVVYLMEDHELPLVGGTATFRTGTRFEPANQVGLGALMGQSMRLGGTESLPPDQLNQALEQRAASVETSLDETAGSASFNTLTEDLNDVFAIFADVVQRPAFAPDRIDLLKSQYAGGIARRNDDPDAVASREFRKLVYGANSPYARTVEYATLNNISRDDILRFYQASIRPEQTILGIVGDFAPESMKRLIAQYFGSWQATGNPLNVTQLPPVNQAQTGVFAVNLPQLTQSSVFVGHLGGQLDYPEHGSLSVMNEVLNGFGGRLFNEVRSRQGLAYSVYAYWSPRWDYPGLFIGGGQTRSDATVPFVQSVKSEINRIRSTPITEVELARAKDSVLNSFVFNFQDRVQTLSRLIRYEYYGYPSDFVFRFQREVENTTIADVQTAAQKYLNPDRLVTLVVGNPQAIQPSLEVLSPNQSVTTIDITIPQPGA
ncbi:MAG: insulinase family protein [Cyanobacteria bacterium Co-bin8]|nr:insulinase family protein [Cyanobacteria bacterium Co-bin8]